MRRGRTLIFVVLIIIIAAVVGCCGLYPVCGSDVSEPATCLCRGLYRGAAHPAGWENHADLLTTIKIAPENVVERDVYG